MMLFSTAITLSLLPITHARPTGVAPRLFGVNAAATGAATQFSQDQINSELLRPALFARVAYCNGDSIKSWSCGPACQAVSGIQVLQTGGDQGAVPFYYIAFDNSTNTVVVAHEGTDPKNILSLANDAKFLLTPLNTTLFPNAPSGLEVHDGFQQTFQRTSDGILAGVQNALQTTGATNVAVTGHSLGAALATMDAVMLSQQLDPSVQLSTVVFGLPRGGNQAWANFVDSSIGSSFSHVTNQHDPVPIVPPRSFGFQQPSGEIHITSVNSQGEATGIVSCPGQDNENCAEGNSLLSASIANHLGPYFNDISFGGPQCSLDSDGTPSSSSPPTTATNSSSSTASSTSGSAKGDDGDSSNGTSSSSSTDASSSAASSTSSSADGGDGDSSTSSSSSSTDASSSVASSTSSSADGGDADSPDADGDEDGDDASGDSDDGDVDDDNDSSSLDDTDPDDSDNPGSTAASADADSSTDPDDSGTSEDTDDSSSGA